MTTLEIMLTCLLTLGVISTVTILLVAVMVAEALRLVRDFCDRI